MWFRLGLWRHNGFEIAGEADLDAALRLRSGQAAGRGGLRGGGGRIMRGMIGLRSGSGRG